MPNVKERIHQALQEGTEYIGIASNQAGIAAGFLDEQMAMKLLMDCYDAILGPGMGHQLIAMCPHGIAACCACRKPSPKMLWDLFDYCDMRLDQALRLDQVLYVGDMETDRECAERAGVDFMWSQEFFGWENGR